MLPESFMQSVWYGKHPLAILLLPLSCLYRLILAIRHLIYLSGILPIQKVRVPVVIVGNITAGGTGKTPLIIWLTAFLQSLGYKPGIISRGYGGTTKTWPQQVRPDSHPALVGDEPVLLAQRTQCPIVVSPGRAAAADELLQHFDCDILLCDDGLQHIALARDIEIAVVDGDRRFGNGFCMPAGPLREPLSRLDSVDLIVANTRAGRNEFLMEYKNLPLRSLTGHEEKAISSLENQTVHAVAAIGNPHRFFSMLRQHNINIKKHEFPDHYRFKSSDLEFDDGLAVVMTEKDAVKCRAYHIENAWYAPVDAKLPETFERRIKLLLEEATRG